MLLMHRDLEDLGGILLDRGGVLMLKDVGILDRGSIEVYKGMLRRLELLVGKGKSYSIYRGGTSGRIIVGIDVLIYYIYLKGGKVHIEEFYRDSEISVGTYSDYLDYKYLGKSNVSVVSLMDKLLLDRDIVYGNDFRVVESVGDSERVKITFKCLDFVSVGNDSSDEVKEVEVDVSISLEGNRVVSMLGTYSEFDGSGDVNSIVITGVDITETLGINVGYTLE